MRGEDWSHVESRDGTEDVVGRSPLRAKLPYGPARRCGLRRRLGITRIHTRATNAMHLLGGIDEEEEERERPRRRGGKWKGKGFHALEELLERRRARLFAAVRARIPAKRFYRLERFITLESAYDTTERRRVAADVVVQGKIDFARWENRHFRGRTV